MKEFPYHHILPESEYLITHDLGVDCNSLCDKDECTFWTCEHLYIDRVIYIYSHHAAIWYCDEDGGYFEEESEDDEPLETAIQRLIQSSLDNA